MGIRKDEKENRFNQVYNNLFIKRRWKEKWSATYVIRMREIQKGATQGRLHVLV